MDEIILIEMQCKDWEHNRVNAGLIRQIKCAFPNRKLHFVGEEKHVKGVERLLKKYDIALEDYYIDFHDWRFKDRKNKNSYKKLLVTIIELYQDANEIVLLSSNGGIALACGELAKKYPNKTFSMVFHSALEEIYRDANTKLKSIMKYYLRDIRYTHRLHIRPMRMKKCIEKCSANNCRFLVYSPNYEEGLRDLVSSDILKKMVFLHHPMYDSVIERDNDNEDILRIGVYGQAVNQNALEIINKYNKEYDNGTVEFSVMAKSGNIILDCKNVKRILSDEFVSNDDLEYEIGGFDYIMVPYDKQQYVVTASGIFCDAISQCIPLLMLNSPYFVYYSRYNVGVVSEGIDEMARMVADLHMNKEKNQEFRTSEKELKSIVFDENIQILREIF